MPGRVEKIFHNDDLNSNGIYAVDLYALGVPHTVIIDDFLPLEEGNNGSFRTMFTEVSEDSALWAPLLEKAFAKYHGNYLHIEAGNPKIGARTLHGGPFEEHDHKDVDADYIWNRLKEHDGSNDILQAGTSGGNDTETSANGIVLGHAYTILGVVELSAGPRLVKLRNPWGSEKWRGRWSDSSDLWNATPNAKTEANFTEADDGIIHL